MAERPAAHEPAHPTAFTYLKVAFTLGSLTGLEVGVFYIDALEGAFLPIFLILSVGQVRAGGSVLHAPEVRQQAVLRGLSSGA